MQVKNPNPAESLPARASAILQIYFEINHLKQLYRQGWLKRRIPADKTESVAEHAFGVAMLAWLLAGQHSPTLNLNKVIKLALMHDIGEIYAGDIVPGDDITPAEKTQLERNAVEKIFTRLPDGQTYLNLWQEYEDGQTPEAKFVKQIDKLEMGLQATVYNNHGFPHTPMSL